VRYAIISDLHGNQEALTTVLQHIHKRGIKEIICLGDVVGYGPNPVECVELVMASCEVCLKGNHDEGLIEGVYLFNPVAKRALEWSRQVLTQTIHPAKDSMWQYLANLPLIYTLDRHTFVHGSTLDPTCDYVLARNVGVDRAKFKEIFDSFDSILFTGHTHMPCVITESLQVYTLPQLNYKYQLQNEKAIINVGSVGQPRDEDPRSCYVEVVDDVCFFHRVSYNYENVYQQILNNPNLDIVLGERLRRGK
jgi:predicted phosphodiesterase